MTLDYNIRLHNPSQGGIGLPVYEVTVTQPCGSVEFSFWDKHPNDIEMRTITCQCTDCKAMTA